MIGGFRVGDLAGTGCGSRGRRAYLAQGADLHPAGAIFITESQTI